MITVQQEEFLPASMLLKERGDQDHSVKQPILPAHPVVQPPPVQPEAEQPPAMSGPVIPTQVPPTAALHRQQAVAAPGQDVLEQLKLREAMGNVLTILMGYAINPTNK